MTTTTHAPARIDLAGGTLDIWPLSVMHPDSVTINLAVSVRAHATVSPRPSGFEIRSLDRDLSAVADTPLGLAELEPGLELPARLIHRLAPTTPLLLELRAEAPAHAGLGGSSALAIAAAGALARHVGLDPGRDELLRIAQDVETTVIAVPTGQQDYLASLWGGLQVLHWDQGGVRREVLEAGGLAERLILYYSGAPRFSGANNWEVTKRRIDGDSEVTRRLESIRVIAREMAESLRNADFDGVAAAMNREWEARRVLTPGITTEEIDGIADKSRKAGAQAFKVCGAGGGGCVVVLTDPGRRMDVEEALRGVGTGKLLDFEIDEKGLEIDITNDDSS